MKTPRTVLHAIALDLLSAPERWCQGEFALDADGRSIGIHAEKARRWCLVGMVNKHAESTDADWRTRGLLERAIVARDRLPEGFSPSIAGWNDAQGRTVEQVAAVVTAALALAGAEEVAPS